MNLIFKNNHVKIEESDIKDICYESYDNQTENEVMEGYDEYDIGLLTEWVMNELNHLTHEFEEGTDGHYKEVEDWNELDRLIENFLEEVIRNRR